MSTSTALVTGATSGIGLHIARQFAEQGWTVIVGARDGARGEEVALEVGGRFLLLDVTNADTIAAAAATVSGLDALINNAGISLDTGATVIETDVEVFRRTYETNIFGVVAVTNAFLPALRRSAHPRIVNYAQALAGDGVKVNALAPGLRATNLNPRAAAAGGDPAEAAAGAIRLAMLPDSGPTGQLFSWDGTVVPW